MPEAVLSDGLYTYMYLYTRIPSCVSVCPLCVALAPACGPRSVAPRPDFLIGRALVSLE